MLLLFGSLLVTFLTQLASAQPVPVDCRGVPNGTAQLDCCGVCDGDGSTCLTCDGQPCYGGANGASYGASYDVCDVCGGDGTSCLDCAGVPNGLAVPDCCGVCDGDGSTCLPCDGRPCYGGPNGASYGASYDVCGVCGGDGTSCLDCAGVPNGTALLDCCGVCDGNGHSCVTCDLRGCYGGPNGASFGAVYDICGVCDGDGTSCLDCAGVPNGTAVVDCCGVCDGDGASCQCACDAPHAERRAKYEQKLAAARKAGDKSKKQKFKQRLVALDALVAQCEFERLSRADCLAHWTAKQAKYRSKRAAGKFSSAKYARKMAAAEQRMIECPE